MRESFGIMCLMQLFVASVGAREIPKAEFFGGYSYLSGEISQGWNSSVNVNLNSWLGVFGALSGHHASRQAVSIDSFTYDLGRSSYLFLVGPRVYCRNTGRVTAFLHGTVGIGSSDSQFLAGLGGGLDVSLTDRISVRFAADKPDLLRLTATVRWPEEVTSSGTL